MREHHQAPGQLAIIRKLAAITDPLDVPLKRFVEIARLAKNALRNIKEFPYNIWYDGEGNPNNVTLGDESEPNHIKMIRTSPTEVLVTAGPFTMTLSGVTEVKIRLMESDDDE